MGGFQGAPKGKPWTTEAIWGGGTGREVVVEGPAAAEPRAATAAHGRLARDPDVDFLAGGRKDEKSSATFLGFRLQPTNLVLPSISILSRDPNLSRKPPEMQGNGSGF